jgi:CheY-like chemotaxis protein
MASDTATLGWNGTSALRLARGRQPAVAASRGLVLVIEHDERRMEVVDRALRALDVSHVWARRGFEGLATARRAPFEVILVNQELPDMSGADVALALGTTGSEVQVIPLVGTFGSIDVIAAINLALGGRGTTTLGQQSRITAGSVAERWANFVLRTIDAAEDPKTVTSWAKTVGVSRSVLAECCRLIHVPAHDARDFARLTRAVCRCGEQWQPEAVLDLADARTLMKLLTRAGLAADTRRTPRMPEFLEQQRWIPNDNPGFLALHALLFDPRRYIGH